MPLSRPQRNIHRDFADAGKLQWTLFLCMRDAGPHPCCRSHSKLFDLHAVLVAEIIALYMPKLVNLHNYSCVPALFA